MQEWDSVKRVFVNLKNVTSTYNSAGFETLKLFENWDKTKNSWVNNARYIYAYDNKMLLIDYKFYFWNASLNKWEGATHIINQYDSAGNKTETVTERWDNVKSSWYNYWRETFEYDNARNKTAYSTFSWPSGSSEWVGDKKYIYGFDINNLLIEECALRWIPFEAEWDSTGKSQFVYNFAKQKIKHTGLMHLTNGWKNFSQSFYSYNQEGLLNETIQYSAEPLGIDTFFLIGKIINEYDSFSNLCNETFYNWKASRNDFVYKNRNSYSFNNLNKQASYQYQNWDTITSGWLSMFRYRYYYDADTNLIANMLENPGAAGNWINVFLNRYEYSPEGKQIAQDKYSEWDETKGYFLKHIRDEYLCKKVPDNSNILYRETHTFRIYPNPVSGNTITVEAYAAVKYILTDIQGNILQKGYLTEGLNLLQTGELKAGIYFIVSEGRTFKLIVN